MEYKLAFVQSIQNPVSVFFFPAFKIFISQIVIQQLERVAHVGRSGVQSSITSFTLSYGHLGLLTQITSNVFCLMQVSNKTRKHGAFLRMAQAKLNAGAKANTFDA